MAKLNYYLIYFADFIFMDGFLPLNLLKYRIINVMFITVCDVIKP